jgi:hypothetical protein
MLFQQDYIYDDVSVVFSENPDERMVMMILHYSGNYLPAKFQTT